MEGVIKRKNFVRQIEILVNSVSSVQFNFPPDQTLEKNAHITKIEAYRVANVAISKTGKTNVADAIFNKASLVLMKKNPSGEIGVDHYPLSSLCRADNSGLVEELNISAIDVNNCFIKVGSVAGLVLDTVFVLAIHYKV